MEKTHNNTALGTAKDANRKLTNALTDVLKLSSQKWESIEAGQDLLKDKKQSQELQIKQLEKRMMQSEEKVKILEANVKQLEAQMSKTNGWVKEVEHVLQVSGSGLEESAKLMVKLNKGFQQSEERTAQTERQLEHLGQYLVVIQRAEMANQSERLLTVKILEQRLDQLESNSNLKGPKKYSRQARTVENLQGLGSSTDEEKENTTHMSRLYGDITSYTSLDRYKDCTNAPVAAKQVRTRKPGWKRGLGRKRINPPD